MRCPLMFRSLQIVFLVSLFNFASAAEAYHVASVPGYDGALPFSLETGYVSVDYENGAELFYYFIKSEADPRRDPVLLWLTGGDRCSVFSSLVFEIGPVKFITEPYNGSVPRLRYNPYSWTKVANILFVDSPVGAGFSFSSDPKGYDVGDVSSSIHLKKFLAKWFSNHPEFLANPFYIGGDSYAGKIVPYLVQKISEDVEAQQVKPAINLKGYLVGNPITGESIDFESRVPYAHGVGIISDQLYETIMEHCQGEDYSNPVNVICARSLSRFNQKIALAVPWEVPRRVYFLETMFKCHRPKRGRCEVDTHLLNECSKPHILYKKCIYVSPRQYNNSGKRVVLMEQLGELNHPPPRPPMDCENYGNYLSYFWANHNGTRDALGIKKDSKKEWVRCHEGDLPYSRDIESSIKYHRNVTLKGYRSLVYSGDHDAVVPLTGTQAWVRSLNFSVTHDWRAWHLHGQSAGCTIAYSNNLTFATVKGGGHTAPEFQPERCLAMFRRWISGNPL